LTLQAKNVKPIFQEVWNLAYQKLSRIDPQEKIEPLKIVWL
jgi:hypothetical protein